VDEVEVEVEVEDVLDNPLRPSNRARRPRSRPRLLREPICIIYANTYREMSDISRNE
jgi:hypothetical protein